MAANATFALNAALCVFRVRLIACSHAIRAFYGQGSTLATCLIFGIQLSLSPAEACGRSCRGRSRNGRSVAAGERNTAAQDCESKHTHYVSFAEPERSRCASASSDPTQQSLRALRHRSR
jgi:hypothetical protein